MENRVLVLAPRGRDAQVVLAVLEREKIDTQVCPSSDSFISHLLDGAGAAIVTEEALNTELLQTLGGYLANQPAWSDLPFVILAIRQPHRRPAHAAASLQELGNVVLLERPVNPETLVSAARSALRARERQYRARRYLNDIETTKLTVEHLNGELESRIQARTGDLAGANDRLMREIADRERMQSKIVQGQKLEAIGRLTGGIAHDFNNLLHIVNLNLQFISRLAKDEKIAAYARRAKDSVDRGARLTAKLLSFSRSQSLLPRLHDVNAMVRNLQELVEVSIGSKVQLRLDLDDEAVWARLDGAQLEMALLNMAVNSRDAMPDGGTLTIRTSVSRSQAGQHWALISVEDTGSGIPEAIQNKVFDPFFTTKPEGEGTGLGLSQVYGFANQSGGSVEVRSEEGVGTTITLRFALAEIPIEDSETVAALPASESKPDLPTEILVVEDDPDVRQGIVEGLRLLSYRVREASDGESGLRELQRRMPDLLMADYLMPGMNGTDFVAAARKLNPKIPVLIATGYADMTEVERSVGAQSVLKKPFDLETLNAAVTRELARWRR